MDRPLILRWEPLDAPGVEEKAEACTWGRLEMRIQSEDGRHHVPTRLFDLRVSALRDAAYGTVLPLAEWMVHSWTHVFDSKRKRPGETGPDGQCYEWDRVHAVRYSGDGMALPDLRVAAREEEGLDIEWRSDADSDADRASFDPVRFVTHGRLQLPAAVVEQEFALFVDSVLQRLREYAVDDARARQLAEDWRVVRDSRHSDFAAQRCGALLGVLWWDTDPEEREHLRRLADQADNPVLQGCLEPGCFGAIGEIEEFAASLWNESEETNRAPARWADLWADLRSVTPAANGEPWHAGWSSAETYRRAVGIRGDKVLPAKHWIGAWASLSQSQPPAGIDAVVAWRSGHRPIRVCDSSRGMGERFAKVRDLYPILFGPGPGEDYAFVFSRQVAGRNSVANAFAAELLAPVALLKSHVASGVVGLHDVAEIAGRIRAPIQCVLHQIQNHRLAVLRHDY